jgi:hypothetical protein
MNAVSAVRRVLFPAERALHRGVGHLLLNLLDEFIQPIKQAFRGKSTESKQNSEPSSVQQSFITSGLVVPKSSFASPTFYNAASWYSEKSLRCPNVSDAASSQDSH